MGNSMPTLGTIAVILIASNNEINVVLTDNCLLPWGKECGPGYKCIGHGCVPNGLTRKVLSSSMAFGTPQSCLEKKNEIIGEVDGNLYCCSNGDGSYILRNEPCTANESEVTPQILQQAMEQQKQLRAQAHRESELSLAMQERKERRAAQNQGCGRRCNNGEKCCCNSNGQCTCATGPQREVMASSVTCT